MCSTRATMCSVSQHANRARNARYTITDNETGELVEMSITAVKPPLAPRWVKLFQEVTTTLAKSQPNLSQQGFRVFLFLAGQAKWDNHVPPAAVVSVELELPAQSVRRTFAALLRRGIIVKLADGYYLSPMIIWKGSPRGYDAACRRLVYEPQKLLGAGV